MTPFDPAKPDVARRTTIEQRDDRIGMWIDVLSVQVAPNDVGFLFKVCVPPSLVIFNLILFEADQFGSGDVLFDFLVIDLRLVAEIGMANSTKMNLNWRT